MHPRWKRVTTSGPCNTCFASVFFFPTEYLIWAFNFKSGHPCYAYVLYTIIYCSLLKRFLKHCKLQKLLYFTKNLTNTLMLASQSSHYRDKGQGIWVSLGTSTWVESKYFGSKDQYFCLKANEQTKESESQTMLQ